MKKKKIISTLSSLAAVATVVPIAATGCKNDEPDIPPVEKINQCEMVDGTNYKLASLYTEDMIHDLSPRETAVEQINIYLEDGTKKEISRKEIKSIKIQNCDATRVYMWCLYDATALESADFSGLTKVNFIGEDFLSGCSSLTEIIFPEENVIETINNGFLNDCKALQSFDLSPLKNIKELGTHFLAGCTSLTTIDLTPFSFLRETPDSFLSGSGITSIDLTPFKDLTTVGSSFLSACDNLTTIDLSPLVNLKEIGDQFLKECRALTTITIPKYNDGNGSGIIKVGSNFLLNCRELKGLDLSFLRNVNIINQSFMNGCEKVSSLDLTKLDRALVIGDYFLNNCYDLTSVDLSGMRTAKSISANNFLSGNSKLQEIIVEENTFDNFVGDKSRAFLAKDKSSPSFSQGIKIVSEERSYRENFYNLFPELDTPVDSRHYQDDYLLTVGNPILVKKNTEYSQAITLMNKNKDVTLDATWKIDVSPESTLSKDALKIKEGKLVVTTTAIGKANATITAQFDGKDVASETLEIEVCNYALQEISDINTSCKDEKPYPTVVFTNDGNPIETLPPDRNLKAESDDIPVDYEAIYNYVEFETNKPVQNAVVKLSGTYRGIELTPITFKINVVGYSLQHVNDYSAKLGDAKTTIELHAIYGYTPTPVTEGIEWLKISAKNDEGEEPPVQEIYADLENGTLTIDPSVTEATVWECTVQVEFSGPGNSKGPGYGSGEFKISITAA